MPVHKAPNDLEIDGLSPASSFIATAGDSLLLHATLVGDADMKAHAGNAARAHREADANRSGKRSPAPGYAEGTAWKCAWGRGSCSRRCGLASRMRRNGTGEIYRFKPPSQLLPSCKGKITPRHCFHPAHRATRLTGATTSRSKPCTKQPGRGSARALLAGCRKKSFARLQFAGDLHLYPSDALERLERSLAGLPLAQSEIGARAFFTGTPATCSALRRRTFSGCCGWRWTSLISSAISASARLRPTG